MQLLKRRAALLLSSLTVTIATVCVYWQTNWCPVHITPATQQVTQAVPELAGQPPLKPVAASGPSVAAEPATPAAVPAASGQPTARKPWKICQKTTEAPAWTVKYGQEFWREARPAERVTRVGQNQGLAPANLNLGDTIERVSHAIRMEESAPYPQAQAGNYRASFDGQGLRFSPHLPLDNTTASAADPGGPGAMSAQHHAKADPATELQFRTVSVRQGDQVLYQPGQSASEWCLLGNTAQTMLNEETGLIEHYEARGEGVELAWVLSRPPVGAGPLVIETELAGLNYTGESGKGMHFADSKGNARARIGMVTAVDANQRRTRLPVAWQGARLVVQVPEYLLARASYPLAIDPTVSPEFGMDAPIIGPAPYYQGSPAIATCGSQFFVIWYDSRSTPDAYGDRMYGTRVTAAGEVLDPLGVLVHVGTSSSAYDIASDGVGYMVAASHEGGVIVRRITLDVNNEVVVSQLTPIAGNYNMPAYSPQIACNGARYLVVWYSGVDPYPLYGRLVNPDGTLFGQTHFPIGDLQRASSPCDVASVGQGGNFLVIQADRRNASDSLNIYGDPQNIDIYGRLVSGDGVVLGTADIPICIGSSIQQNPRVGASVNGYLAVWEDRPYQTWEHCKTYGHIYGVRLQSNGQPIDAQAIPIYTQGYAQGMTSVASDGGNYLVAWTDVINSYPSQNHIAGALVATGTGGEPVVTSVALDNLLWTTVAPAVAFNGSSYLLAWTDMRNTAQADVYATRLSPSGAVLDTGGVLLATATTRPESYATVAGNNSGYLVAWLDMLSSGGKLTATRVGKQGEICDPNGIAIASRANAPIVAGAANGYLVSWNYQVWSGNNYNNVMLGSWISNQGELQHPEGAQLLVNPQNTVGIGFGGLATDGQGFLAVGSVYRNENIYGMWIDVDLNQQLHASEPFEISAGPQVESSPAAASNGEGYLVVWKDGRSTFGPSPNQNFTDIYGKLVSRGGDEVVTMSAEFAICQGFCSQTEPEVAGNGTDYLVGWMDYREMWNGTRIWAFPELYVARVTGAGEVLDPDGFWVCPGAKCQTYPVIASNGGDYLVVWHDYSPNIGGYYYDWGITGDAYGSRVTAAGEVPDTPNGFLINEHNDRPFDWPEDMHLWHSYPQVASDGDNFLVTVTRLDETGVSRVRANLVSLNYPPVANAGTDRSVHPGTVVNLSGSGSSDPDGNYPLTYAWQMISRPTGSAVELSNPATVTPSFVPDVLGDYVIGLVVADSSGEQSPPDTVVISTFNTAPVADAGPDQGLLVLQTTVELSGARSYDDDGDPLTYEWSLVQKPPGSAAALNDVASATPTFIADLYGDYVLSLTVIDAFGDMSQPDSVTVSFTNVKPVANAGGNQAGVVGQTVQLDGSGSSDANGDLLTFAWSFVTTPAGSQVVLSAPVAALTTFVPDVAGTYVASLVVNDGLINSDPNNVTIEVITRQDRIAEILMEVIWRVNAMPGASLKNDNLKGVLTQQVGIGLAMLEKAAYGALANKLENDVLKRTDGCAANSVPDADDYLTNCDAQAQVYPLLIEALGLLQPLL